MASDHPPTRVHGRSITAALLALSLFFCEQALLAQTSEAQLIPASTEIVTVSGGLQWLLTLVVLAVTGAFFFAAVRGIRLGT